MENATINDLLVALLAEHRRTNVLLEQLCRLQPTGGNMSKRELAAAALIEDGFQTITTFAGLARKIGANESTVRKWPEIRAMFDEYNTGRQPRRGHL